MKSKKYKPSARDPGALKSPDWSYWENLATVCLREALQLSLGLDPHSHIPATETDMGSREAYFKRLQIAKNNAFGAEWLVDRVVWEDGDISAEYTEVALKRFANWMVNETTLGAFPNEFFQLAARAVAGASTTKDGLDPGGMNQLSTEEKLTVVGAPKTAEKSNEPTVAQQLKSLGWKPTLQIEATRLWKELKSLGVKPVLKTIAERLHQFALEHQIKSDRGITPSAEYIRSHVISPKAWTRPL